MMRFFDDHGTWADDGLLLGVQVSSPLHLWGFQAMDGAHMNMLRRFCRLHFLSNNDDFHQIKAEATFKSTLKCYNNLKTYICPQIMEWKGQDSGPISITIVTGNIRCTLVLRIFRSLAQIVCNAERHIKADLWYFSLYYFTLAEYSFGQSW
jgi:hypothetical protein